MTQVFAVAFQGQVVLSVIHIANVTAGAVTVQLCAVPAGGAVGVGSALLWAFSIPANDFVELGEGLVLLSGWTIQGLASAPNAITVTVCGLQY